MADSCAVGVPNERRGEVPAIFVQPKQGTEINLDDVERFCREKLSKYKVPKYYFLVDEVPKTKNRKPDRKLLKKQFAEMKDEQKIFRKAPETQ